MFLCYITDRRGFEGTETRQRLALLKRITLAAHAGVDYIQLREKDLVPRALEQLAHAALRAVRGNSETTRLIINGRADIALAAGADGVHLPAGELAPSEIRTLWMRCSTRCPIIGVSAHSPADIRYANACGANFAVLAPVFEKAPTYAEGIGVDALRAACNGGASADNAEATPESHFPVLALGGVTVANARNCLDAGAAGVAGIRLFQQGDVAETVRQLREL